MLATDGNVEGVDEDGIEAAFEPVLDTGITEKVLSAVWVGPGVLVYVTSSQRLHLTVVPALGERRLYTDTIAHLDRPLHLLGYLQDHGKLYCIDRLVFHFFQKKSWVRAVQHHLPWMFRPPGPSLFILFSFRELQVVPYSLPSALLELLALVNAGKVNQAMQLMPQLQDRQRERGARYFEHKGYLREAMTVRTRPE